MKNFHKSFIQNFVVFAGRKVAFEPVSVSDGVLALDEERDAALIAELDRLADKKAKGVRRISAEVMASLKKNTPKAMPPQELGRPIRVYNQPKPPSNASAPSSGQSAPIVGNPPPQPVFTQKIAVTQTAAPPASENVRVAPTETSTAERPIQPKPAAKPRTVKKSELEKAEKGELPKARE